MKNNWNFSVPTLHRSPLSYQVKSLGYYSDVTQALLETVVICHGFIMWLLTGCLTWASPVGSLLTSAWWKTRGRCVCLQASLIFQLMMACPLIISQMSLVCRTVWLGPLLSLWACLPSPCCCERQHLKTSQCVDSKIRIKQTALFHLTHVDHCL